MRRLWRLMGSQPGRRNVLLVIVVIRAIQLPALAWAIGAVINGPIRSRADFTHLATAVGGVSLLAISTQFVMVYRQRLALRIGETIVHELRARVFGKLQQMPMSFFATTKTGRIISRVTSDCESVRTGVQDVFFVSLIQGGQMIGAGVLMAWYDAALFGCVLAVAPLVYAIGRVMRRRLGTAYREVRESFARVTGTIAESVAIIRVTQAMAREDLNARSFGELAADHARYNMNIARESGRLLPALEWSGQLALALIVIVGGHRAIEATNPMPVGDLIQFWFLASLFFSPIQVLGGQYDAALSAMAGAERVFGLLDQEPLWSDSPDAVDLPAGGLGHVQIRDVRFGYEPGRPVLHGVDLDIAGGTTVALVGETGSGKSTLASLIARFYPPTSGQIRIDGVDTMRATASSLASHVAVVHQQNFLFTGTVLENLVAGRPHLVEADAIAALESLGCVSLIAELPDGLRTRAGSRGGRISLGQRQLLCFARASMGDPRVLILDEATSAIDTVTELRIQRAMNRLIRGRTSIVIAHRLSTIRAADRIFVLDAGQVVESGSHDELISRAGLYADQWRRFR